MNDRFREILDSLPHAKPRSCLEPYKQLIQELRFRKRPYREIVHVLAAECGIRVSHSTLHEFVQRHLSARRKSAEDCSQLQAAQKLATKHISEGRPATGGRVMERIEALKRKVENSPKEPRGFQFDSSQPLRLKPGKS